MREGMSMIRWVFTGPPYPDAVDGLLTKAAGLLAEGDGVRFSEGLLCDGAVREPAPGTCRVLIALPGLSDGPAT
jgi:hypothetical protein